MKIVAIGEILWDLIAGEEHLGGAPFNFAAHAARLEHDVAFVSAVGGDARGRRALEQAAQHGLSTSLIKCVPGQETGVVDVAVDCAGQPGYSIRRPAAYDFPFLSDEEIAAPGAARPDWIYFGTLQQTGEAARRLTRRLLDAHPAAGRFYDVNLRRGCYRPDLVEELLRLADVVKLNDKEAVELAGMLGFADGSPERFCRAGTDRFGWRGVCVTRGERGCALLLEGRYAQRPGKRIRVVDAVGAGDAFAAAFLHGLARGWDVERIGDFANRVGALVAGRSGATPAWRPSDLLDRMAAAPRQAGEISESE